MELLPALAAGGIEVRLLAPPGWTPPEGWTLPDGVDLASPGEREPRPGEMFVAHLGNNPYHDWILPLVERFGGVVVLHDLVLHHLLVESTLARDDAGAYRRALEAEYGKAGEALAEARQWGFTAPRDPFLFPARRFVLRFADAVVVHSMWAERLVRPEVPGGHVFRVPMGVAAPGALERDALRLELGIRDGEIAVMHLGFLTPAKGLGAVLEGLAMARAAGRRARLVLVGEGDSGGAVTRAAEAAGLGDAVTWTGWVTTERMRRLPAAADLGVVIRRPSAGETSAAVLRFLACGTPVAVSALPQFLEMPPGVAPRLTPGSEGVELGRLLSEKGEEWFEQSRAPVTRYWRSEHTLERMAAAWIRVLETAGGTR